MLLGPSSLQLGTQAPRGGHTMCTPKTSRTRLGRLSDSALNGSKEYNYGVVTAIAGKLTSRITQIAYTSNASVFRQEVTEKLDTTSCDHGTAFADNALALPAWFWGCTKEGRVKYCHYCNRQRQKSEGSRHAFSCLTRHVPIRRIEYSAIDSWFQIGSGRPGDA